MSPKKQKTSNRPISTLLLAMKTTMTVTMKDSIMMKKSMIDNSLTEKKIKTKLTTKKTMFGLDQEFGNMKLRQYIVKNPHMHRKK
jgi:hypothetical protein